MYIHIVTTEAIKIFVFISYYFQNRILEMSDARPNDQTLRKYFKILMICRYEQKGDTQYWNLCWLSTLFKLYQFEMLTQENSQLMVVESVLINVVLAALLTFFGLWVCSPLCAGFSASPSVCWPPLVGYWGRYPALTGLWLTTDQKVNTL